MKQAKRILVGIDLSWGDQYVSQDLSEPNAEAVRQALWLAKLNSASLDFLFSLDLSAKVQQLISESSALEPTVLSEAKKRLDQLTEEARAQEVEAKSHVLIGDSWIELIRQVLRNDQDLVIIGTRHLGAVQGFLLGSTGISLLRNCPCAVWVTQPLTGNNFDSILVAHDLRPVGDVALEHGCTMAKLQSAQLHVVHAAEYARENPSLSPDAADGKQLYREDARKHIESQLAAANLSQPAQLHYSEESPDVAILNCIKENAVDLLVMGTVGRSGIPGLITGNTAERLLPKIPCSLLAVKPAGFRSPVTCDGEEN